MLCATKFQSCDIWVLLKLLGALEKSSWYFLYPCWIYILDENVKKN